MSKTETKKVLLIGWDGADWKVASKLMDEGKMPTLQKFVSEGVMGNISTLYPVLSPMLWTSIATGKRAHKHGIHGFAEPDPQTGSVRPITNLGRKVKAIWNILNQNGKKCNVVGWWPSHPAEPINGVMVSNHFQSLAAKPAEQKQQKNKEAPGTVGDETGSNLNEEKGKDKRTWPMRPGTVHPADLAAQLAKFRMHPREVVSEQILPFVPDAAKVDQEKDKRLNGLAKIIAETTSIHAVASALMQHEPWDFMGVYYDAIDHFCHGFMKYHPPREEWIPEEDFEMYKYVIETAYVFHDMMLATLLTLAGDDTTVILMSDHGFHPDHLRPQMIGNEPAGPADEHRQFGILAMKGPGIKKDELVFGASLLDITPTVLSMFGLPIARDMDGKPLLDIFESRPEVDMIDSWEQVAGEDGRHSAGAEVDSVDAHEAMKQLVELGYVEELGDDEQKAVTNTIRELRYNLARDYADARKTNEAIQEFAQLWDEFPDESRFGVKLFNCYLQQGRTAEARETLEQLTREKQRYAKEAAEELKQFEAELQQRKEKEERSESAHSGDQQGKDQPETDKRDRDLLESDIRKLRTLRRRSIVNPSAFVFFQGSLLCAEGEYQQAFDVLKKAEGVQKYNLPSLRQKMGECLIGMKKWDEAREQFSLILEVDPVNAHARLGLAKCAQGQGRVKVALEEAASSVGLIYQNPTAHYIMADAYNRLGQLNQAIDCLQTAINQNTVFAEAHRLLAEIYRKQQMHDDADQHERLAAAAQTRIDEYRSGAALPEDADLDLDSVMVKSVEISEIGRQDWDAESDQDSVIIVSGLPRSGTSMMMQMLDAGGIEILTDGVREADESNPKGYYEFEQARKVGRDNSWFGEAKGKCVKIVAQLLPNLPQGPNFRIIFMQRPLVEIVNSQAKMLERMKREGAKRSERQLGKTYLKQVEKVADVLARHDQVSLLPVDYHEALVDPASIARSLNQFLGGGLDEEKMVAAVDPKLRNEFVQPADEKVVVQPS